MKLEPGTSGGPAVTRRAMPLETRLEILFLLTVEQWILTDLAQVHLHGVEARVGTAMLELFLFHLSKYHKVQRCYGI